MDDEMNNLAFVGAHVQLTELARHVIETEGWDADALRVLEPRWQFFVRFVLGLGAVPDQVTGITAGTLEAFARHCDLYGAVAYEDAPVILGAVRLILLRAGYSLQALAALSAPRQRKRAGKSGKPSVYHSARPRDASNPTPTQSVTDERVPKDAETS
jgi:hypothetical protein